MKKQYSNQEGQPIIDVMTIATDLSYEVESQAAFVQLATYTRQWRRQLAVSERASVERSYQVALNQAVEVTTVHLLSESDDTLQIICQEEDDRYLVTDFNLVSNAVRQGSVKSGNNPEQALVVADRNTESTTTTIDAARIMFDCYRQEKRQTASRPAGASD